MDIDTDSSFIDAAILGHPDTVFIAEANRIVRAERYKAASEGFKMKPVEGRMVVNIHFLLSKKDKEWLTFKTRKDTGFRIKRVSLNPSANSVSMDYYIANAGPLTILLDDSLGDTITVLKRIWCAPGHKNETYYPKVYPDQIPSGPYHLDVRSCSRTLDEMIMVGE